MEEVQNTWSQPCHRPNVVAILSTNLKISDTH